MPFASFYVKSMFPMMVGYWNCQQVGWMLPFTVRANACNARKGVGTDNPAAQPRKATDVGERSRVAASATHGRAETYGCKPLGGGRDSWHSAAPTGLDVHILLHRGPRLRLTALRLPTAITFRAYGAE